MLMNRLLDATFGHPRGLLGRLGGMVMARANADQEARTVDRAALQPGDRVFVVGHGPGVGLVLAASAVAASGRVSGVDPSPEMRRLATIRAQTEVERGLVEVRDGTAEATGCPPGSVDVVISVNNIMLWELDRGLAELARVLCPGGRLVVSVHRHVLTTSPDDLASRVRAAGFSDVQVTVRARRHNSPAVELLAYREPAPTDEE
jgi:ubiquinone/menaquinone biosynthesis C-methylase UbiE